MWFLRAGWFGAAVAFRDKPTEAAAPAFKKLRRVEDTLQEYSRPAGKWAGKISAQPAWPEFQPTLLL